MKYEAYRDMIRRLEAEAERDPRAYTRRVAAFGILGYVYILAVFGALALMLWVAPRIGLGHVHNYSYLSTWLMMKLAWFVVPVGFVVLKPLVTSFPRPQGVVLDWMEVPELFTTIEKTAKRLRAPRPHVVILTSAYNCSAIQRPRLGIFGWPENILVLGLPMLETLSPSRFRAVLAHELGHLAASHSTVAGRLYSLSHLWHLLLQRMSERPTFVYRALEGFFAWYGPRFQAMGFVLGRRQEYFADECSRRAASTRAARGALVRIEVMARGYSTLLDEMVRSHMRSTDAPPVELFPAVMRGMREGPNTAQAKAWLDEAMRAETGFEHTHPSLRDRLAAVEPCVLPSVADALNETGPSAAEAMFGTVLDRLTAEIGARWAADHAGAWYAHRERMASLEQVVNDAPDLAVATGPEDVGAAWEALTARLELDNGFDAPARLMQFAAAHPDHVEAQFRLGHALLQQGEAAGLAALERAMALDSDYVPGGCRLALHFLRAQGRGEEADSYMRRAWEFAELEKKSDHERSFLRKRDRFTPHGLDPEVVARLRERIAVESWIAGAHLARRDVTLRPDKPCYVLGITLYRPWYKLVDPAAERHSAKLLLRDPAIPPGTWVFYLEGNLRWVRHRLTAVEGSRVWVRPRGSRSRMPETSRAA